MDGQGEKQHLKGSGGGVETVTMPPSLPLLLPPLAATAGVETVTMPARTGNIGSRVWRVSS